MRPSFAVWIAESSLVTLLAAGLGTLGCDRQVDPYVPPEQEPPASGQIRIPGLGRPAPSQASRIPDGMAGRGSAASPADRAASAAAIRGRLELSEGADPSNGTVLFVIARSGASGPPLAVRRLAPGPFPLEFEIGPEDAMIAGRPFVGPIQLTARLDADGDPLTRQPRDLVARLAEPVDPGAAGLRLVLAPAGP